MKNLKYILPAMTLLGGLIFATQVFAAGYFAAPRSSTAAATSTIIFMTPGAATTTVTYDTYGQNGTNQSGNNNGNTFIAEETGFLLQFTASSTLSQVNVNFEYSDDNVDWYQDTATNPYDAATTTPNISLNSIPQYQWTFSSSTVGGIGAQPTNNRATRLIKTKPILRYERAVISCAAGGLNCAVWAQFLPKKNL